MLKPLRIPIIGLYVYLYPFLRSVILVFYISDRFIERCQRDLTNILDKVTSTTGLETLFLCKFVSSFRSTLLHNAPNARILRKFYYKD